MVVVRCCMKRDYLAAMDQYIKLAIGNAPWPIGVTMVGSPPVFTRGTELRKAFREKMVNLLSSCPRLLQARDFLHAPRTPLLPLLPPWLLPKFSSSAASLPIFHRSTWPPLSSSLFSPCSSSPRLASSAPCSPSSSIPAKHHI
ncbi:hypothetical protein ACFX15_031740 [Malus domestica]